MIRYRLLCERDHGFESWFRDSGAFEQLAAMGQVTCPICGSTSVHKALMAPSVVTRQTGSPPIPAPDDIAAPSPSKATPPDDGQRPVALMDERAQQLRAMMREVHRRVTETADNVGRAFAAEARAIHEGDAPARSIYGQASREEVASLIEDGVALLPLPVLPDDHH